MFVPFLLQHDKAPLSTKQAPQRNVFPQSGVKELDWSAQSPDLDLNQHLWDELEGQLLANINGQFH